MQTTYRIVRDDPEFGWKAGDVLVEEQGRYSIHRVQHGDPVRIHQRLGVCAVSSAPAHPQPVPPTPSGARPSLRLVRSDSPKAG